MPHADFGALRFRPVGENGRIDIVGASRIFADAIAGVLALRQTRFAPGMATSSIAFDTSAATY